MDRDRFLRELEEIKTGRGALDPSGDPSAAPDGDDGLCNRVYLKLVECLAHESKNVEAKLQVLTSALCYYIDLRPHYDILSAEADALGHYLFMECSRLVLGIEFHHLQSDDTFKCAFKSAIGDMYRKLQDYVIGQVFLVLEWLMVNQWSHPTLVAMMKGEDVDKDRALTYIRSGEYPELFRLRVEMLMESGCENFALNLISWCVQSPLFENDVPLRSTHLLLLHKLGRTEQLHSQCCQLSCCTAKEILRHLMTRSDESSFLLMMTQTFLLLNWIKPGDFCCTKELLEFWLTIEHQGEPDDIKFLDSINKVIGLTQDIRQIIIFLEVMVELFESKFIQFCTLLALSSLRKERHRLEVACGCQKDEREADDATGSLVRICRLVARLYADHPQMHLACLLTTLYLEPDGTNFLEVESYVQDLADIPPAEPHSPITVDPHHYTAVFEIVELLRPSKFHLKSGWKDLKLLVLNHLENAGHRLDPDKDVIMTQAMEKNQPIRSSLCLRIKPENSSVSVNSNVGGSSNGINKRDGFSGVAAAQNLVSTSSGSARQMPVTVQFALCQNSANVLDDLKLLGVGKDAGDLWSCNGDGPTPLPISLSSQKLVASGDDSPVVTIYHRQQQVQAAGGSCPSDGAVNFSQLSGHQMVASKMHVGLTLDDVQQVLNTTQTSCDVGSAGGGDIQMDERKLREITAFLLGRHPDGPTTVSAGICPAPLFTGVNDVAAVHASTAFNDSVLRAADGARHPLVVALDATNCASPAVLSYVGAVLPQDNRSEDVQFSMAASFPPSFASSSASVLSSAASQKEVFGLGRVGGPSAVIIPPNAFSSSTNCLGSTILVTESNLPYLQQFLPNLQTVMQSVQSLVRGVPSQSVGSKPDSRPNSSRDDGTGSSDVLQEISDARSFGTVSTPDQHPCFEHESLHKIARTMAAKEIGEGFTSGCDIPFDEARDLAEYEMSDDARETVSLSKEKGRLSSKDGTDADKFYCRFCRRGFSTIAQRWRHTEWLCPKRKATQSALLTGSFLKCDPCGKTFVSKSGHTTHMLRVHFEQDAPEAAPDIEAAEINVKLPDDVTLRDCFVKIVRMDKGSEGSSDEGVELPKFEWPKKAAYVKENGGHSEEACMCDRCGEILSGYDKLSVHKAHCYINLSLEANLLSERLSTEKSPFKQLGSFSILTINNAGQAVSCNANLSENSTVYSRLLPRVALANRNAYFVQNPGQPSAPTLPESAIVKQGAVLEMLRLADHFLKHSQFGTNGFSANEASGHASEGPSRPRLGLSAEGVNAISRSHSVAPVVVNLPKSNHLSTEVSRMPPIGACSSSLGKRVVTIKAVGRGICERLPGSEVRWPKSEPEKPNDGTSFQSNVKPDTVVDGRVAIGKEIVYEGTKMREYVEYQCETCLLTFNESALANAHIEGSDHGNSSVASYRVYVCTNCSIKYCDKQVMRNHILYMCTGCNLGTVVTANQRQLHKCNLCTKAFISGDFLKVHLGLKHGVKNKVVLPSQEWLSNKVTFPVDILTAPSKGLQSSDAKSTCTSADVVFQKPPWSDNTSVVSAAIGAPQPYRFTTPSAVSIPTLEQLTSGYSKISGDEKDDGKCPDLTLLGEAAGTLGPLDASIPDILASIPEHSNTPKQMAITLADGRQVVGAGACLRQRSSKAKGILYKNVFMQCEGTYYCSVCKADLSSRESKKNHRQMPCGDPRTITYSRKYSYLCPYCIEQFPSQKTCRQHQVSECLPLFGVSTEELTVKELVCPLCQKKYFNLIPLKGHMTQVHKLPKVETREILLRLGYMDPSVADGQGKASLTDGFVLPEGIVQQRSLSSGDYTSGDRNGSTEVGVVQRSTQFDFENDVDVSSDCLVKGQDIIVQDSREQCPEMEVIYDTVIFTDKDGKLNGDDVDLTATGEIETDSGIPETEETRLEGFNEPDKNSSFGTDRRLDNWPSVGRNLSEMAAPNFLQESAADSTVSPEQRRRRPRQANEFFVMMFRNYPILAKGVSVCSGCQSQMSSNSEVENHLSQAACTRADGRLADIRRSTIFKCTHCDETFWKAKTCRQHQLDACLPLNGVEVDNLVQPSVACPLCSARSYNRSGLMSHMKYKHGMDTKGVRDIMERYGIRKKTAESVTLPLSASENSAIGNGSLTLTNIGSTDVVREQQSNSNFQKSTNHLELEGGKMPHTLENSTNGSSHSNSEHPLSSSVVVGSCSSPFITKNDASGDQCETQGLCSSIGSSGEDKDHSTMVGMLFSSIT